VVQPPDLKPFEKVKYAITSGVMWYCVPKVGVNTFQLWLSGVVGK
jgi:hypothetical protein